MESNREKKGMVWMVCFVEMELRMNIICFSAALQLACVNFLV